MANPIRESLNDDVLFPDDLPDYGGTSEQYLELDDAEPIDAADVPYDAAQHGLWFAVDDGSGEERYMAAPESLRAFLADAYDEYGDEFRFQVFAAERGPEEHDPWLFRAAVTHNGDGAKIPVDDRTVEVRDVEIDA